MMGRCFLLSLFGFLVAVHSAISDNPSEGDADGESGEIIIEEDGEVDDPVDGADILNIKNKGSGSEQTSQPKRVGLKDVADDYDDALKRIRG